MVNVATCIIHDILVQPNSVVLVVSGTVGDDKISTSFSLKASDLLGKTIQQIETQVVQMLKSWMHTAYTNRQAVIDDNFKSTLESYIGSKVNLDETEV